MIPPIAVSTVFMDAVEPNANLHTATVVGIDEAGYGPLLGPLVVSAAAFDVPVAVLRAVENPADGPNLWNLLKNSVAKRPSRKGCKLTVADSKLLYNGFGSEGGVKNLERAALAFLMQRGEAPRTLRDLLCLVCPEICAQMDEYPWYAAADFPLPVDCRPDDLATQRNALGVAMRNAGIVFRGAWVEIVPEGHYNRLITQTHNKAVVLFAKTTRLIQRVADSAGDRPLRIWVDRQGGRVGYRQALMNAFPEARVDILEETMKRSGYRVSNTGSPWAVRFVLKGETHHLPIALASMYSKYVRELFMTCFNRYWAGHLPELRPTGGYNRDGRRFLADIEAVIAAKQINRDWLVRML